MKYKINLLPEKEKSFLERLSFFLFNYLKYIVVFTQLIVIIVFFYRFQIDQQIIDLKEQVEQKKEIIEVIFPIVEENNRINNKTQEIYNIIKRQKDFTSSIDYILSKIPQSVIINNFEIDEDRFNFDGISKNPMEIELFFNILKQENKFKIIQLKNIKKTENGYIFNIYLEKYHNI